jgi:Zn finger protein HypA/HybF involved in hydrogenase expression
MSRKLLVLLNIVLFAGSMVFCTFENRVSASSHYDVNNCKDCHEKVKDHEKKIKCKECHGKN